MKNFPHQISNLAKLTTALGIIADLVREREDASDDGTLGRALAKNGVYTFRNQGRSIQENLALEAQKPSGNQGFRTAARDIRRFFQLAGLITSEEAGLRLTPKGRELCDAESVIMRNALWRDAMLQLELADTRGRVSHPYRILLRLVADTQGIDNAKLFLCFEAVNDSETEYQRVLSILPLSMPEILANLHVSGSNAANAVKILPAIARQVGDIISSGHRSYPSTPKLVTEDSYDVNDISEGSQISQSKKVTASSIATIPEFGSSDEAVFDLSAAIKMRKKRTVIHHNTVKSIALLLQAEGYSLYEYPYDCLGHKTGRGSVLIEVKTLDGSPGDERKQSEKAIGQLRGYRYYNMPESMKSHRNVDLAAFSIAPSRKTVQFLAASAVQAAWFHRNQWLTTDQAGEISALSADALLAT